MPRDYTHAVIGEDTQDMLPSREDVKVVPQEQMARSVHGSETTHGEAAAELSLPDLENVERVPQEMMNESAYGNGQNENAAALRESGSSSGSEKP